MDPGAKPDHLPNLSTVEEMLIARVYTYIFLKDIGAIYDQLPCLLEDCDIVYIRPTNISDDPVLQRQFKKDFRVRQKAIRDWLYWLKENHPGYSDIGINDGIINSLPVDSSIADRIPVLDVEPEALIAPEAPDVVVPDVIVPDVAAPNASAEDDDDDLYRLTAGIVERDARR
ncbi:hypothetical protein EG328_000713 [Venturia inaequalis]|uniref:DUF6570 domain-containing protein n=1 Tax=Venturia inaequalis TaxID=5025 RepID=A0A8H3YLR6_VENIN|nr:hypothetical protein EG328_000713 [Venturia inaequalis]